MSNISLKLINLKANFLFDFISRLKIDDFVDENLKGKFLNLQKVSIYIVA